ncbi:hypothetical protein A3C67_01695 [Candidatus Nomurabacteria bacterium RIFCSPHIGHO2_02_FULL_42_19]|uniref:Uncharacterized protein n=1 Tax=Candidatus Nomurabacteria bacterium RIFCSPHIGHO2_02_FULL_42_19 TaxID=1801756 RepID=A0A1F6W2H7_9BACT|nr:MAG: hypothetical protein A3C67_01695 [Candidatus Nomurabacteria bacterium RIFCSPHIGHO2_02_FULL_42_19]
MKEIKVSFCRIQYPLFINPIGKASAVSPIYAIAEMRKGLPLGNILDKPNKDVCTAITYSYYSNF